MYFFILLFRYSGISVFCYSVIRLFHDCVIQLFFEFGTPHVTHWAHHLSIDIHLWPNDSWSSHSCPSFASLNFLPLFRSLWILIDLVWYCCTLIWYRFIIWFSLSSLCCLDRVFRRPRKTYKKQWADKSNQRLRQSFWDPDGAGYSADRVVSSPDRLNLKPTPFW